MRRQAWCVAVLSRPGESGPGVGIKNRWMGMRQRLRIVDCERVLNCISGVENELQSHLLSLTERTTRQGRACPPGMIGASPKIEVYCFPRSRGGVGSALALALKTIAAWGAGHCSVGGPAFPEDSDEEDD